jgi:hypothetical protein
VVDTDCIVLDAELHNYSWESILVLIVEYVELMKVGQQKLEEEVVVFEFVELLLLLFIVLLTFRVI